MKNKSYSQKPPKWGKTGKEKARFGSSSFGKSASKFSKSRDDEELGPKGSRRAFTKPSFKDGHKDDRRSSFGGEDKKFSKSFRKDDSFAEKKGRRAPFGKPSFRDDKKRDDRRPASGERDDKRFAKRPRRDDRKHDDFKRDDRRPARAEKTYEPKAPKVSHLSTRQGVYLWGIHAVREAWMNANRTCFRLIGTQAAQTQFLPFYAARRDKGLDCPSFELMEKNEIDMMLPAGAVHQGLVLEVNSLPDFLLFEILQSQNMPETVVVLDQVTDPHNIGAVLRSAAAFGAGAVIVTEKNAPETTGVMAKSASGAMEHVPLVRVVNLARTLQELQQAGYWCVGLAEEGKRNISELDFKGKTALVLGAEGDGLRRLTRETCDELVRLPTQPPIGSLNVSNAAAVSLYEIRRQKTK